jgi:hypothetical protein
VNEPAILTPDAWKLEKPMAFFKLGFLLSDRLTCDAIAVAGPHLSALSSNGQHYSHIISSLVDDEAAEEGTCLFHHHCVI